MVVALREAVGDPVVSAVQAALQHDRQLLASELAVADEIRRSLEAARTEILAKLAMVDKNWERWQLESVLAEVERQMAEWDFRTRSTVQAALTDAAVQGEGLALDALAAGGQQQPYLRPTLGFAHLSAQFSYSADLIKGISAQTLSSVNSTLRRGAMALSSPFEVAQQLGTVTGKGAFATAFHRGEAIARTEMGRSYSQANHATQLELQKLNPGLSKKWLAVVDGRTRPAHAMANDQARPLREPFDVGGERLMYPKDPNGSAENTINCRCVSMPWHPAWDEPLPDAPPASSRFGPDVDRAVADLEAGIKDRIAEQNALLDAVDALGAGADRKTIGDLLAKMQPRVNMTQLGADFRAALLKSLPRTGLALDEVGAWITAVQDLKARIDALMKLGYTSAERRPANLPLDMRNWFVNYWSLSTQNAWNALYNNPFPDGTLKLATTSLQLGLPLDQRISARPARKSYAQSAYDALLSVGQYLENEFDLRTMWDGGLTIGGAGRAAGSWDHGVIHLNRDVVKSYSIISRLKVQMHELLHGVSDYYEIVRTGLEPGQYMQYRGWEEGVVESSAHVLLPGYMESVGYAPAPGYQTYQKYTSALEQIRALTTLSEEQFYLALIREPLATREAYARQLVNDNLVSAYASVATAEFDRWAAVLRQRRG